MMTLLITEDPGRSINVYLRSLVDKLKDLWTNNVRTYDMCIGKMFTLQDNNYVDCEQFSCICNGFWVEH